MSRRQEKRREQQQAAAATRARGWTWFVVPAIVVAAVLCYGRSLAVGFLFDDFFSRPGDLQPAGENPWWLFAPRESPVAGRPLSALTMSINYRLSGEHTASYHVFNTAVHIANAILLWAIVRRTLRLPNVDMRLQALAEPLAAACAIVWLLHPLQTEAVIYIVQRTELLVSSFYLAVIYCSLRSWDSPHSAAWSAAAVACCVLGMLSKEVMVTAPLMVLLYDRAFVAGSWREAFARRWKLYAGLASTWIVLAALMSRGPRTRSVGFDHGFTAWDYLQSQAVAIAEYLRLIVWPVGLCIDYGVLKSFPFFQVAACGAIIIALVALTSWALVKRPALGFFGAWFFIILAPTSSFVPIITEWCAERRAYLPSAAIIVGLIVGGVWLWMRVAPARLQRHAASTGIAATAIVIVALATGTTLRTELYRDRVALFAEAVQHDPDNDRARANYGGEFLRIAQAGREPKQRLDAARKAAEQYEILLTRTHDERGYHQNYAMALMLLDRQAEAETQFRRALELDPNYHKALEGYGELLFAQSRFGDALEIYRRLTALEPFNFNWHYNVGLTLNKLGRRAEALAALEPATNLAVNSDTGLTVVARQLFELQAFDGAAELCRRALQLNPQNTDAANLLRQLEGLRSPTIGSPLIAP